MWVRIEFLVDGCVFGKGNNIYCMNSNTHKDTIKQETDNKKYCAGDDFLAYPNLLLYICIMYVLCVLKIDIKHALSSITFKARKNRQYVFDIFYIKHKCYL